MGITLIDIIVSFCAGVFGAAMGGILPFVIAGLLVLISISGNVMVGPEFTDVLLLNSAFGPFLGPHITFSAGVAAAQYAKLKGHMPSGKDVLTPLSKYNDISVYIVGGITGSLCWIFFKLASGLALPTDNIALTIVFACLLTRLFLSKSGLFGTLDEPLKEKMKASNLWGLMLASEKTEVWLPWQRNFLPLLLLSFALGLGSAALTLVYQNALIGWAIAAISLIALNTDRSGPVWHHIALPASYAVLATGDLFIGALFGVIGGFIGEFIARVFHNHGDTHFDAPSTSIVITTTIIMFVFPVLF
ncbi:hypothetical protein N0O92_12275 [Alkalihalobacillus sp. MEB130]|uniref:hypothetical protein n=1 Tax=Alkalihalobacillus sp. MEB130 TaxID=2976704 RepID=UPI0028DD61D9|nr:hypothetical protein [Alkalihalobacillus sp. MEB130]MDT8861010.1 hypothetical protein [Alkalihalobacillus sp. MEB130]